MLKSLFQFSNKSDFILQKAVISLKLIFTKVNFKKIFLFLQAEIGKTRPGEKAYRDDFLEGIARQVLSMTFSILKSITRRLWQAKKQ